MTGKIQDATRAEMHEYFADVAHRVLSTAVARLERFQDEMAGQIIADAEAMTKEATDV